MFQTLLKQQVPNLSPEQVNLLTGHYELLLRWNKVMNLTRITRAPQAVEEHYAESLFLAERLPTECSILDIGSGAGFPGIPVAAIRPACQVTLVESHHRKAAFLKEATRGWPNVNVLSRRVEEVSGHFDWALCRAVRWEDVELDAARLSDAAALLAGPVPPRDGLFRWSPAVKLPWGEQRFLYLGQLFHVEHS